MGPINYSFDALLEVKNAGVPAEALESLRKSADEILTQPTVNVTQRRIKAPSGNPHDYISIGIYWWPDETKPDGLPYVRRDGYVNPDTQDKASLGTVVSRVHTLALAAFYFGENKYAEYAERQLYDWFLNPESYMEPNGRYAQAIPGICDGRSAGLIDFAYNSPLFNGIGILEKMNLISEKTILGVREWYIRFTDWLLTHELGVEEDLAPNNHGTWYDAQILTAAAFTDRPQLIKKILSSSYSRRIKTQAKPDGSLPHELKRTKALAYSIYTIRAYLEIANLAEANGFSEYWSSDPETGECLIKKCIDFLYPFVTKKEPLPFTELYPERTPPQLAELLLSLDKRFPGELYREKAEPYLDKSATERLIPVK